MPEIPVRLAGLTAVRLVWGGMLTVMPGPVLSAVTGRSATRTQRTVLRVLGTRHLLQGIGSALHPTRPVLGYGSAADLLHAGTCAGAAAVSREWRHPALLDGACAIGLAAGGLACLPHPG